MMRAAFICDSAAAYVCKHRFDAARVQLQPCSHCDDDENDLSFPSVRPAASHQFDLRLNWRIMSPGDGPCLNLNRLLAPKAAAAFDFVLVAARPSVATNAVLCLEKLVLCGRRSRSELP
jgi:hypothetical protein